MPLSELLPVLLVDGYKVGHKFQYPDDTTMVYSNFTPRSSRTGEQEVMLFGLQYFIKEYLMRQFDENFFRRDVDEVIEEYTRRMDAYLGPGAITTDHIKELHGLGYIPLEIKAVPEGTLVPLRVPMFTMRNTRPEFYWLTNMIETIMSNVVWGACTSATTAYRYRREFDRFARETGGDMDFVPRQGHDFSFRGLTGVENACISGAAHLLSFIGTDTVPAIDFLERYYGADATKEVVGESVAATEHSVMCMGQKDSEMSTILRLIEDVYPTGIVSIVSDTWDLWKVMTEYLPQMHDQIMSRDGKVVIRPDSGDPELILCGDSESPHGEAARKGVLELLWEEFGGELNATGFRVIDEHVGAIYGEAINPERQISILQRMKEMGFASTNITFGVGSFTYQFVTRDTYGFAIKSTYGETRSRGGIPIFKDPVTDSGLKKSAVGLLAVLKNPEGQLYVSENVSWEQERQGELKTVFSDGVDYRPQTLRTIRAHVETQMRERVG